MCRNWWGLLRSVEMSSEMNIMFVLEDIFRFGTKQSNWFNAVSVQWLSLCFIYLFYFLWWIATANIFTLIQVKYFMIVRHLAWWPKNGNIRSLAYTVNEWMESVILIPGGLFQSSHNNNGHWAIAVHCGKQVKHPTNQ